MKTAEEIVREVFSNPFHDDFYAIIDAMKIYANAKLDESAEKAKVKKLKLVHGNITKYVYIVESQSILSLKDQI